jgi:hypothetical protein
MRWQEVVAGATGLLTYAASAHAMWAAAAVGGLVLAYLSWTLLPPARRILTGEAGGTPLTAAQAFLAGLAGLASYVWVRHESVVALAGLLALEAVIRYVQALGGKDPFHQAIDPLVQRAVRYGALLVLAALAGPAVHLPAMDALAATLVAAQASSLLNMVGGEASGVGAGKQQ